MQLCHFFSFILESVLQVIHRCEVHTKVEASNLHNRDMLVFRSSARVLKQSGRTILFYDIRSVVFSCCEKLSKLLKLCIFLSLPKIQFLQTKAPHWKQRKKAFKAQTKIVFF